MIDLQRIREDTIGVTDSLFLNSAGSSLPPRSVVDIAERYWREEAHVGGYGYADQMKGEIDAFYDVVAELVNTQPKNIAMAVSATDAYIRALSSIPFQPGDVILTTNDDYVSNQIHFISLEKRMGIRIARIANLENGDLDLDDAERQLNEFNPRLVSATHIPTNSGLIQDVEALGALCSKYDCLYLVDACQSIGQMPVDVGRIQCDFLSATGRKFLRGPRGTGFLYVSDSVLNKGLEPLFPDLHGAEWTSPGEYKIQPSARRFELWEWQYATILGLREAARYAMEIGLDEIWTYNQKVLAHLSDGLESIYGVTQYDKGSRRGNIVTLVKEGRSFEDTQQHLRDHGVASSTADKISAQIDFGAKGVEWVIRLSPHYFNTGDEIDQVLEIIEAL